MSPDSERLSSNSAGRAQFPPTLWSVVLLARQNSSEQSHDALATLCRAYWFPLYAYLRRQGRSPHDAQDLPRGFLLHLVEKLSLRRVKPKKGKFRSFLRAPLKYFLADERDRHQEKKRGGGATFTPLDEKD